MAEARQGVAPLLAQGIHAYKIDPTTHTLQGSIDSQGIMIFIPGPRHILRNTLRAIWRARNKVVEAFYPLPVSVVVACSFVAVWQVVKRPQSAIRTGRLAQLLWTIDSRLPWTAHLPTSLRVAYLTFNTSAVVMFGITALQRALLRRVLSYTQWVFEARGPRSLKTKVWGFLLRYVVVRGNKKSLMCTYQNCLPTLPLPSLEDTTRRYMTSVVPLLPPAEYAALETMLTDFLKNEGPKLQWYLRAKHAYSANYVSDWWVDLVYLRGRDSLTLNSNYFCTGRVNTSTNRQASRAAKLVQLFVQTKLEIDHEELPPQTIQGIVPMCMQQHLLAFSTTRQPHREQDKLVTYSSKASRHIIVLHKGRMYSVDCFSQTSRRPLTAKQLEACLEGIMQDDSPLDPLEAAVPVLTSLDRDAWADLRERCFLQVAGNNVTLDVIEKALFVLALDDTTSKNLDEEGLNYFIGDGGKNRWVDKSFHLIVTKDAKLGIEAEHSWGDAPALGQLFELVMARELTEEPYDENGFVKKVARDVKKETLGKKKAYAAHRLRVIVTPLLAKSISDAIPKVATMLADLDYKTLYLQGLGQNLIKRAKYGPDPWIQMALQLAYFRDQGRFDQTYESSMTRLFKHGRTETIRTVTAQSCAWVRAMEDPSVSNEERVKLLRIATEAHSAFSANALVGQGLDRHMFALYVISVGTKTPSAFLQNALGRKWKLSTSQVLQRYNVANTWPNDDQGNVYPLTSGGFGPVADDGYGVCYCLVGDNRIIFHVTSKKSAPNTESARFVERIEKAMWEIRALFPAVPDIAPLKKA